MFATAYAAEVDPAKAARYYEDAVERYNAGEYEAAIIQLKNALQQDPALLPAMALMGETYVATGNGAAAETALNEAAKAGADPALTAVPLAKAYLLQFKHAKLLKQPVPKGLPLRERAELLEVKAEAALQVNDRKGLDDILTEVDRLDPNSMAALSIKATMAIRDGRFEEAAGFVDQAARVAPDNTLVLLTRASLHHAQDHAEQALADYDRVSAADPGNADARLARIGLLIDLGRDAETAADFTALGERGKADPRLQYLRALKFARAGDEQGARSALNETANTIETLGRPLVNRNLQLLLVAGIVNYQLGNTAAARSYLEDYVKSAGGETETRTMLASTLIRQGEHRKAAKIIEQIIEGQGESPDLLALLARAYAGAEQHHRAAAALERAVALRPDDPALSTKLALTWASRGQAGTAINALEDVFARSDADPLAGLHLAVLALNRGDPAAAEQVARTLHAKQPKNLTVMNLLGIALTAGGKLSEARAMFEQILSLDPDYRPAAINLGKLDRREGRFASAEQRFNTLRGARPDDPQLLLELARTCAAKGDHKTALKWGGDAIALAPKSFEIARLLIDLHLVQGDFVKARDVAWQQEQNHPHNLFVLESQAQILLAQRQTDEARTILKRMVDAAEFNTDWLLRIAEMQVGANLLGDAQYALYKAVQGQPDSAPARGRLAEVELRLGNVEAASALADELMTAFPKAPAAFALRGDVLMARGEAAAAASEFRHALDLDDPPRPDIALRYHLARRKAGDEAAAAGFLNDWLARFPEASWAKGALAEQAMSTGDYATAARLFKAFDEAIPNHPSTLNNLANAVLKLGDIAGALGYARRAQAAQPRDPLINDTLGWILVQSDQAAEGLRYLREARTRAANVPEIRYHLAVALHQLGRVDEATAELVEALNTGADFDGKAEALRLEAEIKG